MRLRFGIWACLLLGTLEAISSVEADETAKQVEALKAQLAAKELESEVENMANSGEDKSKLVEGLMDVMAKLKEIEASAANSAPAPPVKNEKVEEAVRAFEQSMSQGDGDAKVPIEEDELHACALMAARRYTAGAGTAASPTPADETWILLQRFLGVASAGSALSPGEASKTKVFKGIVVCLKKLDKQGLSDFSVAGGFAPQSLYSLPDDMAEEAESKKGAITWQGEVFQLGFKKQRWEQLRRSIGSFISPPSAVAAEGSDISRAEL
jgi:hypothetical protein